MKYTNAAIFTSALLTMLLPARPAWAALEDELQVYTDDINAPGEAGLELHLNSTPSSRTAPTYPGEITDGHGVRLTPEFSWGLSPSLEPGFYLPVVRDSSGHTDLAGEKVRLKWLPVQARQASDWYAGSNIEVSWLGYRYEPARRLVEMRNIIGWRSPAWSLALNPTFRWGLAPGYRGAPEAELDVRAMRSWGDRTKAGLEFYDTLGRTTAIDPPALQSRLLLAAVELKLPHQWGLRLGIGHGWGSADRTVVTSIIDVPI